MVDCANGSVLADFFRGLQREAGDTQPLRIAVEGHGSKTSRLRARRCIESFGKGERKQLSLRSSTKSVGKEKPPTVTGWGFMFGGAGGN